MSRKWADFPHAHDAYDYAGATLKKNWARLHRGDCEPFPSAEWVEKTFADAPAAKKAAGKLGADPEGAARALQDAWRAYHRGDFQAACEQGLALGVIGHTVADKATSMYATFLEKDKKARLALFGQAAQRSEAAAKAMPEHANAHYLVAYCLGRHSQGSSVMEAIAQGVAGRIKKALDRTLALEPRHADAHTATGTYHAEVIDKVGALIGGLTYGANQADALAHYRKALALNPDSAIARVEYARGLLMLDDSKLANAKKLLADAEKVKPADATERLDVELAHERLAAL
jgi:tetratricopeptide (TPR) repeat protein